MMLLSIFFFQSSLNHFDLNFSLLNFIDDMVCFPSKENRIEYSLKVLFLDLQISVFTILFHSFIRNKFAVDTSA